MRGRLLIRGGRLVDPAMGIDAPSDVLIEDGRIQAVDTRIEIVDTRVLDASNLVVAPGFVDPHAHLCEPGWEHRETIRTGARAAAAGGYTSLCAMPDTDPPVDNPAAVGFVVGKGKRADGARVHPAAALSVGLKGERLTEFGELVEAGAIAITDGGRPVRSTSLMRLALLYAKSFDVPVLAHAHDADLARGGVMHEGVVSTRLGLRGIPAVGEAIGVSRELALAESTAGRVHIQRVSTAAAAGLIARARDRGIRVTAEATPHHLMLSHEMLGGFGTQYKVNPPLRTGLDVDGVRAALVDGTIDCVATDHAPRHYDEKERAFDDAPFGVVGLETTFAVLHTHLVLEGAMELPTLIQRMSPAPAAALGIEAGSLARGMPADLVMIDTTRRWTIRPSRFLSRGCSTPFHGEEVVGKVVRTLVGGRTTWRLPDSG